MIELFKRKSFDERWNEVVSELREHGVNVDDIISFLESHGYDRVEILFRLENILERVMEGEKYSWLIELYRELYNKMMIYKSLNERGER